MSNFLFTVLAVLLAVTLFWVVLWIIRRSDAKEDKKNSEVRDVTIAHRRALAAVTATALVVVLLGGIDVFVHAPPHESRADLIGLGFVSVFSGLVGFTEIAQRYKDRPLRLLTVTPALIYVYINMGAGVGAFALVDEFNVFDKVTPDGVLHALPHAMLYKVMLASFSAVAFFRSSFFTARVGETDVDIGPATVLKGLLTMTDQLVNRWQGAERAGEIASLMKPVNFDKARSSLPTLCFSSVSFITKDQQAAFGESINQMISKIDDPIQRSIILGVYLTQFVGPDVLTRAVAAMGDTIKGNAPTPPATAALL